MNEKIAFLDMDGVLADFAAQAMKRCRIDVKNLINRSTALTPPEIALQQRLFLETDYSDTFWKTMPLMENAQKLFHLTQQTFDDVYILSRFIPPQKNPERLHVVRQLKRDWFYKFVCMDFPKNHIIVSPHPKSRYLPVFQEGYLIDDQISNIKEWEKAGGAGIIYKNIKQFEKCLTALNIQKKIRER